MPALKPYPRFKALKALLKQSADEHVAIWRRPAYRCVELKWAHPEHLISGEGSQINGSRWMAPRLTPVVYASSTEGIALKEARQNFAHYGIQARNRPRVSVELNIELEAVINLPRLLEVIPWPKLSELLEENWGAVNDLGQETVSQATGRALFELGYEGVRVPSTRDSRGFNLFYFPENRRTGSKVEIVGLHELEMWLA